MSNRKPVTGISLVDVAPKCNPEGPQPPDNTPNVGHIPKVGVLACVAEDMANRWLRGTSITTIRRKLYVGPSRAEEIIRAGIVARLHRRVA